MLSRYLTIDVENVLVALAVGADIWETAEEVTVKGYPDLQALARVDGPTLVSPAV